MSYLLNHPSTFAEESTDGFVAAHRALVRRVPGGVARATATPVGQVAVVIGGGSGHYPAFAGLVGIGLAHAAALGDVFASPSTQQIYSVARSVATDAGVLLGYGNYAGDVLNFEMAQQRLLADGIPCRTIRVTDDIYSAPADRRQDRRGIAGDLAVFRAAGWAAERGRDLDDVFEIARRANDRTRSLGVAFSGCTLPGAGQPLFTVPHGQMAVGMGIHGEPGIDMRPLPTAHDLGELLVKALLDEIPGDIPTASGGRVGVIVNGLGSIKSEELFVTFATVAAALERAGIAIVDPEVGEYATSFEMAGISLTFLWLDDELEAAWTSPAYTPAYRKGAARAADESVIADSFVETAPADEAAESADAAAAGGIAFEVIDAMRAVLDREADHLGRLDAIAGDGDHGIGMQRGSQAAARAAEAAVAVGAGVGTVLSRAGEAWADKAGGTSGALWGAALRAAGRRIGDKTAPRAADLAAAVDAARDAVQDLGKAVVGDKTLVDALVPFADGLTASVRSGQSISDAWRSAAGDATAAAMATATLVPRLGRARTHTHSSLGTPDPGAISLAMAVTAASDVLRDSAARIQEAARKGDS